MLAQVVEVLLSMYRLVTPVASPNTSVFLSAVEPNLVQKVHLDGE